jgi:hypothetical protein
MTNSIRIVFFNSIRIVFSFFFRSKIFANSIRIVFFNYLFIFYYLI